MLINTIQYKTYVILQSSSTFDNLCSLPFETDLGVGLSVTTVTATDSDTNPNIQYSFTSTGNPGGYFAIDQYSGIITLARSLDRETQDGYTLELEATDTEYTATMTLEVIVTDENDNAPVFRQESYQVGSYLVLLGGVSQILSSVTNDSCCYKLLKSLLLIGYQQICH